MPQIAKLITKEAHDDGHEGLPLSQVEQAL
jgi:hypothetical protein